MLGPLGESRGRLQHEVRRVARGDPGDDGLPAAAAAAKDGRLEPQELKPLPGVPRPVHVLQPQPVLDPRDVHRPLPGQVEPVQGQGVTAPGHVGRVHPHAEAGAGKVGMVGDETRRQDVGGGVPVEAFGEPSEPLGRRRLAEARRVVEDPVGGSRVLLPALTQGVRGVDGHDVLEPLHAEVRRSHVLSPEPGLEVLEGDPLRAERGRGDLVREVEERRARSGLRSLGRRTDLVVDGVPREIRAELCPVLAARVHEAVLLPDLGNPVDDVEPQEPEHFGLLKVQLRTLRIPERGLHDELRRGNAAAPARRPRPAEPPPGHLRSALQAVPVRDQRRGHQEAGQAPGERLLEALHHRAVHGSGGQLDEHLACGTLRGGHEVRGDVRQLGDPSRSVEPGVQLGSGVFPEIEPLGERPARRSPGPVAIRARRPHRRGEIPRLDMDVARDLDVVVRSSRLEELEAHEDAGVGRARRKRQRDQQQEQKPTSMRTHSSSALPRSHMSGPSTLPSWTRGDLPLRTRTS